MRIKWIMSYQLRWIEAQTAGLYIASVFLIFCQMCSAKQRSVASAGAVSDVAAVSDDAKCHNFTVGNPHKKEFFSPNYPNNYPSNTQCTLVITAPLGHMVLLDFRDRFHLESSPTCEYDRLEVRDGEYGYSPLVNLNNGQYCGDDFPSMIYSTKRHMWVHFSSDDSIEYEGFKAVYEYVPIPSHGKNGHDHNTECSFKLTGQSGIIKKSEIDHLGNKYRTDESIDCMWTIEADVGKKLYLNFKHYKLEKPNDCVTNYIQVFNDGRTVDKEMGKFCGTTAEPKKSDSNVAHIRLFTQQPAFLGTEFTLHFTAFRELAKDEQCDAKTEFNCGDQTCIDISLKCDKEDDCKYRYDEEPILCLQTLGAGILLSSNHMIIILVVFFCLVVAMCASISISCYNKIQDRQLREREYKERRSKEASVEATIDRRIEDDEGGCYVPEKKATVPVKKGDLSQQQFSYISESFESLASDVIVPPAPPPVPLHMKERRDPPQPTYRIVGGKVIASPSASQPSTHLASQPTSTWRAPEDQKGSWLRGSDLNHSPGPTRFGASSRVTPDRGTLLMSAFRAPYAEQGGRASATDSSRAASGASTLSAPPDRILGKR